MAKGRPSTAATLSASYVDARERVDVDAAVGLLAEQATLAMPPMPLRLRGGVNAPRVLDVLTVRGTRIAAVTAFVDDALF